MISSDWQSHIFEIKMGPKFGPNGKKFGPKLGFLLVYQVAMLDIKYRFTCGNWDLS